MAIVTLLLLAISLSLTFRLITTTTAPTWITQKTKQRLVVFHAFAIEGVQLMLAAWGMYDVSIAPTTLKCIIMAAKYAAAIFAVDIIENLVNLSALQHPVQAQTLVLTRKVLWPALVSLFSGRCDKGILSGLEDGGVTVYAKRGFGLQRVEKLFLVQRVRPRRKSASYTEGLDREEFNLVVMQGSEKTATTTSKTRRHSFPDDQLNTRPLLSDNRIERSLSHDGSHDGSADTERSTPDDGSAEIETPTLKPRGRVPSTVTQTSCDGSESSIGKVMARVGEIDRKGSRSRETSAKRQDHAAPKWRPAGGRVKLQSR